LLVLCSSGPLVSEFHIARPRLLPLDCQARSRASCRLSTLFMNHPHSLSIPPTIGWMAPMSSGMLPKKPALVPGNSTAFSAVAPSERPHRPNIRGLCCDHLPCPEYLIALTSARLISSARIGAFCLPDPHCPALWPICYIPPAKLPVCFDDLYMHNRLCGRAIGEQDALGPRCAADFMVGRWRSAHPGALCVRLPIFGRVGWRSGIEHQRRR
jgi:hypothetical protein